MTRRRALRPLGAFVLLVVVASCSSSRASTAPPPTTISTTTTTTIPAAKPSRGCTLSAGRFVTGVVARTVVSGGVAHRYLLSVPANYEPNRPTPLVLLFHGHGSDANEFATLTRMPVKGAARGDIVATPDGPNQTWQLNGAGSDATFVDEIVSTLSMSLCVDLHRVYAAGFSQGAAFAIIYGCARPGRVAAIATVAVDLQLGCKKPVAYIAFHGTHDPLVPYQNGAIGGSLPGVKVRGTVLNLGDWARLDRCNPVPAPSAIGTEIQRLSWTRCADGTDVELYTIENGSHTWPGADPKRSPLYTTNQIDATTLMLDFFRRHHLAGA